MGGQTADILGRKCYELLHYRDDEPAPGCPMEKLLASGQVETMEMEVEALEGVYLVSCTPVFDVQGNLQKVIHIATDITARKRAEEALSKSHLELQETAQRLEQSMNMLQLVEVPVDADQPVHASSPCRSAGAPEVSFLKSRTASGGTVKRSE